MKCDKYKDFFAITLIYTFFCLFGYLIYHLIINIIYPSINNLFILIYSILNIEAKFNLAVTTVDFNFVKVIFVYIIFSFLTAFIIFKTKKFKYTNIALITVLIIPLLIFIYISKICLLAIFLLLIIILFICFVKIGSGLYFNIFENLEILLYESDYSTKSLNDVDFKIFFIIIFLNLSISLTIMYIFGVNIIISLALTLALTLFIYANNPNINKLKSVLVRLCYSILFLVGSIYTSSISNNSIIYFIVIIFSFYSIIEEVLNLKDEIKKNIFENSAFYYYKNKNLKIETLNKHYIPLNILKNNTLREELLVIQILIRYRLKLEKELTVLCEKYINLNYSGYIQLIEFILFSTKSNKKYNLNRMANYKNQKIYVIKVYEIYANVLLKNKELNKAKAIYYEIFLYISKDKLSKIIDIYKNQNKKGYYNKFINYIQNYIDY